MVIVRRGEEEGGLDGGTVELEPQEIASGAEVAQLGIALDEELALGIA